MFFKKVKYNIEKLLDRRSVLRGAGVVVVVVVAAVVVVDRVRRARGRSARRSGQLRPHGCRPRVLGVV